MLYMNGRLSQNSFSTYICYTPDGLFWLNLYFLWQKAATICCLENKGLIFKVAFTENKVRSKKIGLEANYNALSVSIPPMRLH